MESIHVQGTLIRMPVTLARSYIVLCFKIIKIYDDNLQGAATWLESLQGRRTMFAARTQGSLSSVRQLLASVELQSGCHYVWLGS